MHPRHTKPAGIPFAYCGGEPAARPEPVNTSLMTIILPIVLLFTLLVVAPFMISVIIFRALEEKQLSKRAESRVTV